MTTLIHPKTIFISGLPDLWEETLGVPEVCVAILDGAVDRSHLSLVGATLTQLNSLVPNISARGSAAQHGTHVTSIIFGQHHESVKGIAPQCRGLLIPIFTDGKRGGIAPCSQLDLARAILLAANHGAQIINISGGQLTPSGEADPLLAKAVRHCQNHNILIVAAAGNEGCECLHIPGALPSVLTVGAMNAEGIPLNFSNWGEKYRLQGILAFGENILGAVPGGGIATSSGTSYATAIVSGIAALLLSLQMKRGQTLNPQAVRAAILQSAIACKDQPAPDCRRLLAGRLNVKGAMSIILQQGGAMSDNVEVATVKSVPIEEAQSPPSPNLTQQPIPAVQAATSSISTSEIVPQIENNQILKEQLEEGVERISVPGVIMGQVMLMSGQTVPIILPTLRCMYSWTTSALIKAVCGKAPAESALEQDREAYSQRCQSVINFLERVYYELRNLGITPQERAINYSATNALNVEQIFECAIREEMDLDTIEVEPSPLCRPDSECWDVKLTFFNPQRVYEQARKVYRFTVDVSDVCPVSVGKVRSWFVR